MFDTDNLSYVDLHLLNGQVDIILQALQLYAFNLHNVWDVEVNSTKEELRNVLVFHTYEQILSKYNNTKVSYDVLRACRLEKRRQKIKEYNKRKKVA